jgi:hypothetical protein
MASPFQKYQGEQVQQIAPGFIEAYGRAGQSIGAGIAGFAEQVVKGYQVGQEKEKQEALLKGQLEPYIKNDERTKRVNSLVSGGVLVKNADGTVGISAKYADKVDINEANKLLDFYNTTGGDGSKLTGDVLTNFAARYQGEQKYAAEQAATAKAKLDNQLTEAKIADLRAKALANYAAAGQTKDVLGLMGFGTSALPPAPEGYTPSPAYTEPSADVGIAPVTPAISTAPAVEPMGVAQPSAPVTPAVSPALTAGTAPAEKAAAPTPAPKPAPAAAAAPAPKPAPAPTEAAKPATTPAAPAPAAPAPKPATPAAAQAPQPEIDLVKEGRIYAERVKDISNRKTAVLRERDYAIETANAEINAAKRSMTLNPNNPNAIRMAGLVETFQKGRLESIESSYKSKVDALDNEQKAVESEWQALQTSAQAGRNKKADIRAEKADVRAEEASAMAKRGEQREIEKISKDEAAKKVEAEDKAVADYPTYAVFSHTGQGMYLKGDRPAQFGIAALTAKDKGEARELAEGWLKGSEFLIRLDDTIQNRVRLGDDYSQRMRITAGDMRNFYEAELAKIFGVATFRRAIVSGGNFSDSDRQFVQNAIAYINSLDPIEDVEDYGKAVGVLARYVDSMYRTAMSGYDMQYEKEPLLQRAALLEKAGYSGRAATERSKVNEAERFFNRFSINPNSYNKPGEDLVAFRQALWGELRGLRKFKEREFPEPKPREEGK